MILDLSLASVVRASSGALMVAFGVYLLSVRPATPRSRALGFYHLAFGPIFILNNLFRLDLSALALAFLAEVPLILAAAGALAILAWREAGAQSGARRWLILGLSILAGANVAVAWLVPPDFASAYASAADTAEVRAALDGAYRYSRGGATLSSAAAAALLIVLAHRFRRTKDPQDRNRLAFLAAGLAAYPVFGEASNLLSEPLTRMGGWIAMIPFALAALAWAHATRGPAARAARNASLFITLTGLAGICVSFLGDDFGLLGVSRIVGLAILAYAVFRLDLLGTGFEARTIRRGTVATTGLASVFIIAQVAQEFFAAEYGLLMGGVIAGALLFAARPIERALSRPPIHHEGADAGAPHARPNAQERARETYRRAVRLALQDGVLTSSEEVALAEIADDLGIGAADAVRIRQAVEAASLQEVR